MYKKLFIFIIIFMTYSCSFVPVKNQENLGYKVPENYKKLNTKVTKDELTESLWWHSINDNNLNKLVDLVIKNNLDIKLAISRVKAVESQFKITGSMKYPTVDGGAGYGYSRQPGFSIDMSKLPPEVGLKAQSNHIYTLRTGLRFELDIWGKLAGTENAAIAELLASKENLKTIYLTMIASAVTLYYDIVTANKDIELLKDSLQTYESSLAIEKRRYILGIGSKLNIELTTQKIESAKVNLLTAKQNLQLKQHQLTLLTGKYPEHIFNFTDNLPEIDAVPVGLPSDLLKNRSDIKSAEYKMDSARQMIGVAKADLFPSLSLTTTLGFINITELDNLFNGDYLTSSLGINANQVLFAGGSKTAKLEQQRELYKQSVLNYKKTVISAFKDVEDALVSFEALYNIKKAMKNNVNAAKNVLLESEKRYLNGILTYNRLLDAQNSFFNTQRQLINIQKLHIYSKVQLHKSLGGNWFKTE